MNGVTDLEFRRAWKRILESFPPDEASAIKKFAASGETYRFSRAVRGAVRELGGGSPTSSEDRFAVLLHSCDRPGPLEDKDALTRGAVRIMESIDPGWASGENMGQDWIDHEGVHPDASLLLDLIVRRTLGPPDMVLAIEAGLEVLRRGGALSDHQVKRLHSCWRWCADSVWCRAVDALLRGIGDRDGDESLASA